MVNQSIQELKDKYNKGIAPKSILEINLFYLTDEKRERIVNTTNGFALADGEKIFSAEELLAEVDNYPERFSPNVLMRPPPKYFYPTYVI